MGHLLLAMQLSETEFFSNWLRLRGHEKLPLSETKRRHVFDQFMADVKDLIVDRLPKETGATP